MNIGEAHALENGGAQDFQERLATAEAALREEVRRTDALNRIAAAIASGDDLETLVQAVVDGGVELTGAEFGAFFYNVVDEAGGRYTLYTLSGAPRSAFERFPMPRNTEIFAPTFNGEGVVRSDDITLDPRYGRNTPYDGMPEGHLPVRSYLAAPVTSLSGKVLGGLFFGHSRTGVFSPRLDTLIEGVAAQAAIALDNMQLRLTAGQETAERLRTEAALTDSEERFRLVADTIPTLCWIADARGDVVWFNHRWYEYTGTTPDETIDEAISQSWRSAHDPAELPQIMSEWRRNIAAGQLFETVFRLRGADGVSRPFLTRVEPSRHPVTGKVTRWFGVNVDVAAETAARERLQFALQAGRLGSWELDVESRNYEASDQCKANYGRRPEQTFTFDDLVASIHPNDRERMSTAMEEAIRTGAEYDIEYRAVTPAAEVRWLHVRGRAAQTADHGGVRRMAGISLDVTERKRAEERQRLLLNELNHRVKNTLATVQSIASQTLRSADTADAFRDAFEARLMALSQTHNLLTDQNWEGASLHDILAMELTPHAGRHSDGGARFLLDSDRDVRLTPKAAVALGMAVHELATNALKHGALSSPDGRVTVRALSKDRDHLSLEWIESGGPPVSPPARRGFGGRLLERGLAAELAGRVKLDYNPDGLSCRMELPLHALEPKE
jgi:PAS domain S-box-containing protein